MFYSNLSTPFLSPLEEHVLISAFSFVQNFYTAMADNVLRKTTVISSSQFICFSVLHMELHKVEAFSFKSEL